MAKSKSKQPQSQQEPTHYVTGTSPKRPRKIPQYNVTEEAFNGLLGLLCKKKD